MKGKFQEKYGPWALVTGGTSGIGAEFCKQLAEKGLNLVLVARKKEGLEAKQKLLQGEYGIEVKTIQADLSVSTAYERVINDVRDLEIGLFIPAAGVENHGDITKIDLDKELALIQLNVTSVFALSHYFARTMSKRGKGGILMISSIIGHMPNPYLSNYAGSLAYKYNFGASLHWELKKKGVDVTVLCPGFTATPMMDNMSDLDFSKAPVKPMDPSDVVQCGLKALGRTPVAIPGFKNKFMVFMGKRVVSFSKAISMGGKMMETAMGIGKN